MPLSYTIDCLLKDDAGRIDFGAKWHVRYLREYFEDMLGKCRSDIQNGKIEQANFYYSLFCNESLEPRIRHRRELLIANDPSSEELEILDKLQNDLDSYYDSLFSENSKSQPFHKIKNKSEVTTNKNESKTKRKYTKGEVTQKQAAALLGVSLRRFQKWEGGAARPEGFTARSDGMAFSAWAIAYQRRQKLKDMAVKMNRATPTDPKSLESVAEGESAW